MSLDLATYKKEKSVPAENFFNKQVSLRKKFPDKKKEAFYKELGILFNAGVDFKKALEILQKQSSNKTDQEIIRQIKDAVVEGKSICEAMTATGLFSPYEYYSVQIGEETGKLEDVLLELQKFFARKLQMRRQIISVLTYPCIVLTVTFLVLYFMLTKVVPMFSSVFRQFGSELPKSTQYIIMLSNNSGIIFTLFAAVIFILIFMHFYLKDKEGYRKTISGVVIKVPYFGSLVRKIYISRFCQSMNLLTSAKTPLISSLSLTRKMISFYPIESSLEEIKNDITRGHSLSESLQKHAIYESKMISMIEVAEQVNELDTMFERLSEQYNEEINHQTKMIGVILEPLIIIIIGLIVGIIMISMYAPMFDLSKIINN